VSDDAAEPALIRIARPPVRSPDADIPFTVLLDDAEAGELEHGGDVTLEVAPGTHRIELRVGDAGSPVREVTVGPGERVLLGCRSRAAGVNMVFNLFGRGHYISWIAEQRRA
jgi:hypothetical protein